MNTLIPLACIAGMYPVRCGSHRITAVLYSNHLIGIDEKNLKLLTCIVTGLFDELLLTFNS